ncbi:hypothetical protein C7M16_01787 [Bacillus subtilis]|nr:hypothetical protein BGM23_11795 [Bacillus sp. FJAT-14266]AOL29844.1 hypothetical protein BGM20_04055 [Alkalicoccobacillus gibsonii]KOS70483.1 hypothetical protein AEA11_10520 [Bacillus subtilis]QHJ94743.1 hypothetical protein C7M16_01787 [Bacillus subtilis]BET54924.1 hypothetical protein BsubNA05_20300 [Bacillus subtilis]
MNQDIQFLKELQQELKYQDSDGQASPRFWTVGDYEWVEAREENAERYSVYLPAGMIQRLLTIRFRKLGFSASVSARALIILYPIFSSLAQGGIRPHLSLPRRLLDPSLMIVRMFCEGATL